MKKKLIVIVTALSALLLCVFGLAVSVQAVNGVEDGTICSGVSIDSIDIGGMTMEEAGNAVDAYIKARQDTVLSLDIDGKAGIEMTLGELGYTADSNTFLEEAEAIGKTGNLIQRYKALKDVEVNGQNYTLNFTIDSKKVKKLVKAKGKEFDVPAQNASLKRTNGKFVVTPQVNGRTIDVSNTLKLIEDTIFNNWDFTSDISLSAVVADKMPKYTTEDMEMCDTLLGTHKTPFHSSGGNRTQNLVNGARLIDGTVLLPGEVYSVNDATGPFNAANGYAQAGAYEKGKVIQSYGGGICQVSSTLYNAVLYSELEVVERAAHSMTVSYAWLSNDAAIAGTYKDFKFKNNTEYPIYIEGYTLNREIYFNIYGHETRDLERRKIAYEYKILETKEPGPDVITEDPTQPPTYRKVTQEEHVGYTTQLFKVVYIDGKEVERKKVNTSYYQSAPKYVTVGTKGVKDTEETTDDTEDKTDQGEGDKTEDKKPDKNEDKKPDKTEDKKPDKTEDKKPDKTEDKKPDKTGDKKPDKTEGKDTSTEEKVDADTGGEVPPEETVVDNDEPVLDPAE